MRRMERSSKEDALTREYVLVGEEIVILAWWVSHADAKTAKYFPTRHP